MAAEKQEEVRNSQRDNLYFSILSNLEARLGFQIYIIYFILSIKFSLIYLVKVYKKFRLS